MTKEEIIHSKTDGWVGGMTHGDEQKIVYPAMDDYAKQECIAFMEAYQFGKIPFEKEPDEVGELYELYLQSKSLVV